MRTNDFCAGCEPGCEACICFSDPIDTAVFDYFHRVGVLPTDLQIRTAQLLALFGLLPNQLAPSAGRPGRLTLGRPDEAPGPG